MIHFPACSSIFQLILPVVCSFKKYESWKDRLPDMSWLSDLVPDSERSRRAIADLKHYMSFVKLPEKGWLKSKVETFKGALPELKEGL